MINPLIDLLAYGKRQQDRFSANPGQLRFMITLDFNGELWMYRLNQTSEL
ncbi:MAG: hypothetical protein AAGE59_03725 [Cyanobacteria bacterium P01_F01_bin.86]